MSGTPDVNPKNLKDLLVAVERITKSTTDAEGVQKELANEGFGDITLPDIQALMHTVQDKKTTKPSEPPQPEKPPEPPAQVDVKVTPPEPPTEPTTGDTEPTIVIPDGVRAAPLKEIDDLITRGYGPAGIEKILKASYHNGWRDVVRRRFKAGVAGSASAQATSPESTAPPVAGGPTVETIPAASNTAVEASFDPVEALKFMQTLNLPQGGSVSQPTGAPSNQKAVAERWRDWRQNIESLLKLNKGNMDTNTAALIAEQMGSPDIAAVVRNQGLSALINQNLAQLGAPMPFNAGQPATGYPNVTPTGGPTTMADRMKANFEGMMEMAMMWKMFAPIMNNMGAGMSGDGAANPQSVVAATQFAEMMKRLDKQEQDRVMDGLRNEIKSLQQNPAASAQVDQLKFQLQMIQGQRDKDAETERLRMAMDASKSSGNNVKDMYESIAKLNAEASTRLETEKLAHQRDVDAATARERQAYMERLRDLENKLQSIQSSTTMSPLEQYTQMRTLVKDEVADLQKIAGSDKGTNFPEILSSTLREFAPAVTEAIKLRGAGGGAAAARPVGPTAAAQTVATAGKLQGNCPWCSQLVSIDDVDGSVPCPSCGKAIWPHGQPGAETVQGPVAPQGPSPTPIPQSSVEPPIIQYVGPDGQTLTRRNPRSPVIV